MLRMPPPEDLINTLLRPPPTAIYSINSPHFRTLNELPPNVRQVLPRLPTPMKRFYSDQGRKQELAGAYPLNSPKSILRSSGPDPIHREVSLEDGSDLASTLNLTESLRHLNMNKKMELDREDSDASTAAESTSFTSSSDHGGSNTTRKHIQFDPRVTVTEYEDSVPRQWVTECELERFKMETVKLAQQYLVAHPEALATYTTMRLDPVTGTMRRKALFSMPCLSNVVMDEPDEQQQEAGKKAAAAGAAKTHVKSILLVEQDKFILNALRLTLGGVFPEARFTTVESAKEALYAYSRALSAGTTEQHHGFDIVVAEDGHLHHGLKASDTAIMPTPTHELLQSTSWSDQGSAESISSCHSAQIEELMRLFDQIQRLDDEVYSTKCPSSDLQWRPLLVGISAPSPSERCIQTSSSIHGAADFVWSLPLPRLDQSHRDEIVSVLIKKRSKRHKTLHHFSYNN